MRVQNPPPALPIITIMSFFTLTMAGCGSGGGGSSAGSGGGGGGTAATVISGTAAFGSPITGGTCTGSLGGVVTLRDSASPAHTATVATDCNGNYSFSLGSTFQPPYMVSVSYTVGGVAYQLTSAGTAASINSSGQGTINITPLTNLIIANVGHDLVSNIFSNANYASLLTPAALAAGQSALDQQIAPLLSQLGLSATIDLLGSSFQANGTGVDALLNVLSVNIDPITKLATITNALNSASVVDNITSTTLNTTAISTAGTTSSALTDLQGIEAAFQAFATQLAAGNASSPGLIALFDATNFLHDGMGLTTFLQGIVGNTSAGGAVQSALTLSPVPSYASAAVPVSATASYRVDFDHGGANFILYHSSAGPWIILGDQQLAASQVYSDSGAVMPGAAGNTSQMTCSGLEIDVKDNGAFTAPQALSYAIVTGPGLPAGGVLKFKSGTNGNGLTLAAGGPSTYVGTATPVYTGNGQAGLCGSGSAYWLTDAGIGAMSPGGTYTFALYYDNGTPTNLSDDVLLATYTANLAVPPLASTQLTGAFATSAMASPSLASVAATGGTSTISWTPPSVPGMEIKSVDISLPFAGGQNSVQLKTFSSTTATSVVATVPQTTIPSGYQAGINIWYGDPQGRSFISQF